jgi:putative nucleotidyltransferase with HDIG domain
MTSTSSTARGRKPSVPPPFPAVALQLIQQMQDPGASATDVGRMIQLDPSLTASLLRLVNSPFFGLRQQICGVPDAVMVIGMGAVRRMVLSLAVVGPLRQSSAQIEFVQARWHHTVTCAAVARRLLIDDPVESELAFTAGLLHDMGEVQLLQLHGADYADIHTAHPGEDLRPIEFERFGQSHDTLGADLLESWGLPQPIAAAARHHHAESCEGLTPVQHAVWVANRAAEPAIDGPRSCGLPAASIPAVEEALRAARAEIETLVGLLHR